jgi:hypothetical protein
VELDHKALQFNFLVDGELVQLFNPVHRRQMHIADWDFLLILDVSLLRHEIVV